jgi:hypothetical protein
MGITQIFYAVPMDGINKLVSNGWDDFSVHCMSLVNGRPEVNEKINAMHASFIASVIKDNPQYTTINVDICVDIDKSWCGIDHILTKNRGVDAQILEAVILGGHKINEDTDVPCDAYMTVEEVKAVSAALRRKNIKTWATNLRLGEYNQDNPYPDTCETRQEFLDFVLPHLENLIGFFKEASDRGLAVLRIVG